MWGNFQALGEAQECEGGRERLGQCVRRYMAGGNDGGKGAQGADGLRDLLGCLVSK